MLGASAADGCEPGVLERLKAREAQRAAEAARRQEGAHTAADPRESVAAFLSDFGAQRRELEGALQAACAGGEAGREALGGVLAGISDLEQAVAAATYFLPPYDLRQATLAVGGLREQLEAAQAAIQPRKKFSFSRKPAAAAAAAAAGGPAAPPGSAAAEQQGDPAPAAAAADAEPGAPSTSGRTITGLRGAVVVEPRASMLGASGAPEDYTLSALEDCTIFLPGPIAALFMHRLRRCTVVTGPVGGATLAEDLEDCTLMLASRQVRIHAAQRCDLYVRVLSNPIIEHSGALRFAPYAPSYPSAAEELEVAGLGGESGLWREVHDFGWLRSSASPHWALLPEHERRAPPELPA